MQDLLTTACTAVEIAAAALLILAAISPRRKAKAPAIATPAEPEVTQADEWPSCNLLGNPALFGSDVEAKKKALAGLATHPVVMAAPKEHIDAILAPTREKITIAAINIHPAVVGSASHDIEAVPTPAIAATGKRRRGRPKKQAS